jgi:plasmid maintenance system antidote protein VapI
MMPKRSSAESFRPSDFIREEVRARKWTWQQFADAAGMTLATACDLAFGERDVCDCSAMHLAQAFGTSTSLWLNLQRSWDEWCETKR